MNLTPMLAELNFAAGRHRHHRRGRHRHRRVPAALSWCSAATPRSARTRCWSCPAANTATGRTARKVGFRIVKGGGTFVWPIFEKVDILSLELLTIDVQTPEVYTSKGVPVKVDGVAQIKVKGDDISIRTAAEQFLSKGTDEITNIATQTLEGHLRAILGTMTVEEIYQNRDAFASEGPGSGRRRHGEHGPGHRQLHHPRHPRRQGYLDALGKPRIAQVKRDAIIAQAEADRDSHDPFRAGEAGRAGGASSPPTPRSPRRNAIINPTSRNIRPR